MSLIDYRLRLRLRSGLGTPLAADTLWGHIAWAIRYADGEQALHDWLSRYDQGEPPLVLSDPIPAEWLPKPAFPEVPPPLDPPSEEELDANKRATKRAWLSVQSWRNIFTRLTAQTLLDAILSDTEPPVPVQSAPAHAAINRLTGGTAQEGGGTLYTTDRWDYAHDARLFDVWLRSSEPPPRLRELFDTALAGGYGKRAASGLGELVVEELERRSPPGAQRPNAAVLLGPATPRPGDPTRGFFHLDVRCGRLGGDFAIGPTPDGSYQRQKKPVRCLRRGSVLIADNPPSYVGRVLSGVHPYEPIRHYAMAPTLPCRLDDETLAHPLLKEAAA